MKRIIAFLSLILVLSAFCGCSGPPVGFQDVENIATVDFMFDDGGKYNYSFDIESGVFSADCLDESTEYVLEQTEIEAILAAIEPAGKWPGDFRYSSAGYNYPQRYNMVITYADGTECVLTGISSNGSNWPEGFEELKSTLDGIVQARVESDIENVVNNELQSYVSDDFAVGNVIDFGVYNDQTLQWQVLTVDNGMALLFLNNNIQTEDGSDYALPYNEEGGKTTWSDCSLRAWLNDEFYENAFGNNKEAIILTTNCTGDYDEITIQPDDSSSGDETCGTVVVEYHSDGGEDTDDYVFVLSKEEVESYIGDVSLLPWSNMFYLRTPCADNNSVLMVKINTGEMIMCPGYQFDYGVRPAIWVDINYWSASD